MCPRDQDNMMSRRGLGFMEMSTFHRVIDQVRMYAETIDLYLAGEALLHPEIVEMIRYCGRQGLRSVLHTNASFLTEDKARLILESPLTLLDISCDGATKETYEQIRVGGDYEETLRNIERYLELKLRMPHPSPHTTIHMIYMDRNKHEVEKFIRQWRKPGVDAVRVKAFNRTGLPGERGELGPVTGVPHAVSVPRRRPCPLLWRFFVVHWDGTAVPCCMDFTGQERLGNIMASPFSELWNGSQIRHLRSLHIEGKMDEIPLCRTCAVPVIGLPMLLASALVDNTTIKKKIIPVIERLWALNRIQAFRYFENT